MDELVKDLKNIASKKGEGEEYLSMNSKYIPIMVETKNFHEIPTLETEYKAKKILFVDGGNSILFESAAFCIGFIRIGGIFYQDNNRSGKVSEEFYIFVKEDDGKYAVKTYPETSFNNISFDPEDESLKNGLERCDVSRVISVIRRFAEIDHAYRHSKDIDYILLDGTLEARYPLEDKYLEKLHSTGKACSLSKTCSLTTKNGLGITKLLDDSGNMTNMKSWYYNPIVVNKNPRHRSDIYFVKLNQGSKYVFRFEIQEGFKQDREGLFAILSINSKDPIFLGYPYGLIDVDQYVRVSDEESELLRTKMSVKFGKDWNDFSKHLNGVNAHSVLDKIKF